MGGMKLYTLEWQARLTIQHDQWKNGGAFEGYWSSFSVMQEPPSAEDMIWARLGPTIPKEFVKGATIVLTGESRLQKTENGWRVLSSSVKTEQTLNNERSSAALAELQRQHDLAMLEQQRAQAAKEQEGAAMAAAAGRFSEERSHNPAFIPPRIGLLNDFASAVASGSNAALAEQLTASSNSHESQIVVVTLPDIGKAKLADVCQALRREWKLEADGRNAAVIVLLVPKETSSDKKGHLYIDAGTGGGALAQETVDSIRRQAIPVFVSRDYSAGLQYIVTALDERLAGTR
ncbi:MAG: TPM domain-containing protein [Gemmatimonadota bacterium]|nr:TPM domain-containing protein [Gemmatimonadota bacterium]